MLQPHWWPDDEVQFGMTRRYLVLISLHFQVEANERVFIARYQKQVDLSMRAWFVSFISSKARGLSSEEGRYCSCSPHSLDHYDGESIGSANNTHPNCLAPNWCRGMMLGQKHCLNHITIRSSRIWYLVTSPYLAKAHQRGSRFDSGREFSYRDGTPFVVAHFGVERTAHFIRALVTSASYH